MTPTVPSLFEPGSFFGTYRVVRPLGCGGMGWVCLVDGPDAGTRYALKVLDPEIAGRKPEFVRRFIREAEFTMNARHSNMVEVYDAGQDDERGFCYLTMEYMSGGSLRTLLQAEGALSVRGAVEIARDIAHGLRFVEENGLVHRDVKPDNVLFSADGRAKLTDLGISRFADAGEDDSSRTMAGKIVGTPGYMAPEQMMDAHVVDIRADIYSLGVILYEMLVGERPNASDSVMSSLAKALCGSTLPDVRERRPDVPEGLARLIGEMTRPDPSDRPASAAYLVELLEDPALLAAERSAAATPPAPSAPAPAEAPAQDERMSQAVMAVFFALVVLAAVVVFLLAKGGR